MTLRLHSLLSARFRHACLLLTISLLIVIALPAAAQTNSATEPYTADPTELAQRLMGVTTPLFIPPVTPQYKPGDKLDFNVGKTTSPNPSRVHATLAATAGNIDLWVEDGIPIGATPDDMGKVADTLDRILNVLRWRVTYGAPQNVPDAVFDSTNLFPIPDIDNDPHIFFLYTTDLADDLRGVYNPYDSQPASIGPGGYSNQHEVIAINTSPYPGLPLNDNQLTGMAVRSLFDLVVLTNFPGQPAWLTEALGWFLLQEFQETPLTAQDVASFLNVPNTTITQMSTLTTAGPTRAGQLLFLTYFSQRFGDSSLLSLFLAQGKGLDPLTSVLAQRRVDDPITGAPVTGMDVFADFLVTNGINGAFGDRRYIYVQPRLDPRNMAAGVTTRDLTDFQLTSQTVNQYGAAYIRAGQQTAGVVTVKFDGQATTPRLSMPADAASDNHFYWSGGGRGRDAMLTRTFDLSTVQRATLTFDAWYDLADAWNYAYVEVSKDDGKTWKIVPPSGSASENRNGVAYGPGFTGVSSSNGPQPFPGLGVGFASDGLTVETIVSGGAAANSDLQQGDKIIGYDGKPWPGPRDLTGLLGQHNPGDTIAFLVQRGVQQVTVPITLAAHPTRVKPSQPVWQPQSVDLTSYVGEKILVRFEVLNVANRDDQGFALDNLAVQALNYRDDAEAESDWTIDGWQRVDNQVPQKFLLQALTLGSQLHPPTLRSWIGPESSATSGEWKLALDAQEGLILAVSAVSDDTIQPATYSVQITNG